MIEPTRGWKSDEERGQVGAWFVRAIGDRSLDQVAKDMADRGHAHKVDYYRGIMSGSKKPGRVLLAALVEYLGSSPSGYRQIARDATAQAIADQTEVLKLLVDETRKTRVAQETTAKALGELAGLVAKALRREGTTTEPVPRALAGTRR